MINEAFASTCTDYGWISRDEEEEDRYIAGRPTADSPSTQPGTRRCSSLPTSGRPRSTGHLRKTLPVYVAVGEHDPAHGQLALVNAIVERLKSAGLQDVKLETYPGARHEVFTETNRDEVYAELIAWMNSKVHQPA
jgi:alpha-beta hydrolase superfamily lysophospholipase